MVLNVDIAQWLVRWTSTPETTVRFRLSTLIYFIMYRKFKEISDNELI